MTTFRSSALLLAILPAVSFAQRPSTAARPARTSALAPAHPLDPLSGPEIARAVQLIKASAEFPTGAYFPIVVLNEPPKDEVLSYRAGATFRREAFAVLYDRQANRTFEAVVDLRASKVTSWRERPGVQPGFMLAELSQVSDIVKADGRWQDAMKRRGYKDLGNLHVEPWAPGTVGVTTAEGPRLVRALTFDRTGATSNVYSRPVEGVDVVVDLNRGKVFEFEDRGVIPVSRAAEQFEASRVGSLRAPLKPLRISQPNGTNFEVRGHEIRWQRWRFRYALHPRDGLVLYQVGYEDGGKVRPILYRAALSEMVVPYGDADRGWAWRDAFDVGEYGIGRLASYLIPKRDGPENATFMDAQFADELGKPYVAKHVVTLYERDGGLLWKHFDINVEHTESRRGRELVLGFLAGVGNYDYGINWIFRQDGSMALQADLTGVLLAKGVTQTTMSSEHDTNGLHLVAPNVAAPHHQHFFNFRLDFDVDGPRNSVIELNVQPDADPVSNPAGNAFRILQHTLATERTAARDLNMAQARKWVIANPTTRNALGAPTAYLLVPGDNSIPYALAGSSVRSRAGFIDHHLWVTRYRANEMYAAGDYPNQSRGGDGLPQWISDDESLENADDVVWYTTGVTHIPRPEDWPVMPVVHTGFELLPMGFFTRNPAMDVR